MTQEESKSSSIHSETVSEVKEYIGETFTSEAIVISQEKLKTFLEVTGDTNPIHFDKWRAKESVFSEIVSGQLVIPGFLTLALCANEKVLYEALKINQPHEVVSLEVTSRFITPIPVDARIIYEYRLKSARDRTIQSRPAAIVDWNITAFMVAEKDKKACMNVTWTVAYVALTGNHKS